MGRLRDAMWWVMFAVRFCTVCMMCIQAVYYFDVGAAFFALVELHAVVLGVQNEFRTKRAADASWSGVLIPVMYCLSSWIVPVGSPSFQGQVCITCCALALLKVRFTLGERYSFAGSTWVRLCDTGAYSWVRHPMLSLQICLRFVVLYQYLSLWNMVSFLIFFFIQILVVIWEDQFLMRRDEYREYARRVRYRLFPGVW